MHFNTFPVIAADPGEFKKKVEALGKKAIVMNYGEEILL
jgi:L-ascorbate metabolism protein UlaG (beta-lactamase superfamily)